RRGHRNRSKRASPWRSDRPPTPRPRVCAHRSSSARFHVRSCARPRRGGGRELAYVALSRARNRTTIYATADELSQAVNDLQTDWGVEHHQRWVSASSASFGVHPESQRRADGPALTAASMEGARVRIAVLERD